MESLDPYPWQSLLILLGVCFMVIVAVLLTLFIEWKVLHDFGKQTRFNKVISLMLSVVVCGVMSIVLFTGDKVSSTFHATGVLLELLFTGGV